MRFSFKGVWFRIKGLGYMGNSLSCEDCEDAQNWLAKDDSGEDRRTACGDQGLCLPGVVKMRNPFMRCERVVQLNPNTLNPVNPEL